MAFPLDSVLFLVIAGYLLGSAPLHHRLRPGLCLVVFESLESLLATLLARSVSGPGMGMALACLATIAGQHWPLLGRARRPPFHYLAFGKLRLKVDRTLVALAGPLILVSPPAALWVVALWSLGLCLTRYATVASALPALALGPLLWYCTGYDLWAIFGLLVGTVILYQQVPYLERVSRGREPSVDCNALALVHQGHRRYRSHSVARRISAFGRATVILGTILLLVTFLLNRWVYRGFGPQQEVFRHGNPAQRYVALTFDDGPDPKFTGPILDVLRANQVHATFFLVGRHVRAYPDLAARIAAEGHELGNHTDTHRNLFLLPPKRVTQEIRRAEDTIESVTGQRPHLFRPPRGLYDRNLLDLLSQRRYTLALWSLSSRDWAELSPGEIERNILSRVRSGDVLLFHDSGAIISAQGGDRDNTVRALGRILKELKARGYNLVTVSQLASLAAITGAR